MFQKAYRVKDGSLINTATYKHSTQFFTPLEASLINVRHMFNESAAWSNVQ